MHLANALNGSHGTLCTSVNCRIVAETYYKDRMHVEYFMFSYISEAPVVTHPSFLYSYATAGTLEIYRCREIIKLVENEPHPPAPAAQPKMGGPTGNEPSRGRQ